MPSLTSRSNGDRGSGGARWQRIIGTLSGLPKIALISTLGPALLLVAGYLLWRNYGAAHLNTMLYGVQSQNIVLTPQPVWIRSNVLDEVCEGSNLERLSTLDRQMSAVFYNAFRSHPWIRRVIHVGKAAGGIVRVNVEYREPLAMVYCELPSPPDSLSAATASNEWTVKTSTPSKAPTNNQKISFLPVDAEGVLLPTQDFQPEQVRQFMLIYAQGAVPIGMIGSEYGDARIKEALLLCRLVKDVREKLGLERVYVYADPSGQGPSQWTLELTTRDKRISWGHPPGLESPGEPGFSAKLRKLGDFILSPTSSEATLTELDLVVSAKSALSNKLFAPND